MNVVAFLDSVSAKRRNLGLPSSHLGGRVREVLRRNGVRVDLDGLHIWGSVAHEYYFLDSVRAAEWEPFTGELYKTFACRGTTVLDIGANIGYYTVLAAGRGAHVHAFEPDPRNLKYLRKNISVNRLDKNVTIVEKAVTSSVGVNSFYQHESLLESSLLKELGTTEAIQVQSTTVDHYSRELHVDVIKMDIEGAELQALHGMQQFVDRCRNSLTMFVECYPAGLRMAGASGKLIVDWLQENHFRVEAINEKGRRTMPIDAVDLDEPSFDGEPVRAFNLLCSRK